MKKKIAAVVCFLLLAGLLALAAYKINKLTNEIDENVETDSIFVLPDNTKVKTDLPEELPKESIFAENGAAASSSPAVWKATSADGKVMYMVGTMHALSVSDYPMSAALGEAFAACDTLAVEIYNVDASRMTDSYEHMDQFLPNGDSIDKHLTAEQYELLQKKLTENGESADSFDEYMPWYAYDELTYISDGDDSGDKKVFHKFGIDSILQISANAEGKEIVSLETVQEKYDNKEKLTDEEAGLLIKNTCIGRSVDYDKLLAAWKSGDYETAFGMTVTREGFSDEEKTVWDAYIEHSIFDRNKIMVERAEQQLGEGKTLLVAVGTAHFGGEKGIVRLLEQDGFTVERIG
ncbi:hypothetical protein SAMN02910447_00871 [Ruminococcus sp. YE71]|uniref:TraB/GumN family protein n=1 Tax=unclassified Ruminococcus TaxID=2608920 RepID=UPI0008837087|nr:MULTISPECIES: TraB/GumN family protein [unclassified Ruminococcus]SDA14636.1 hypothetical protein SAMN02910446_00870 [Ruminococcus sp. YE78]SFW21268.1 hypothetical protein SAMN02910447_00871 [Ruminococcus sp. YE71]